MKHKNDLSIFFLTGLAVLLLDQASKYVIRQGLAAGNSIGILPFFQIKHLFNTGAGFSILQGNNALLVWVGIIVLGIVLYFSGSYEGREAVWMGLVLGGILGNLFDRIAFGGVTDFLAVSIWPVFNLADSAITIGIIAYIIETLAAGNAGKN